MSMTGEVSEITKKCEIITENDSAKEKRMSLNAFGLQLTKDQAFVKKQLFDQHLLPHP